MPSWILAIDFGTSYTVAAARVAERAPEIVEIAGERRTPSVVMVDPGGEVFVGRTAEDLSTAHPGSTLRALKNRIGDQTPVILGGRPHQVVTLVAALLREVYDQVVVQFGEPPAEVRLTHPATWNQPRIRRLIEAAVKAGLPNLLLVPEPVAAALSYAADVGLSPGRPIVVYDLGGGTFDSAVVTARDGGFAVIGRPEGDQHIGGELFDELMVNHVGALLEPQAWEAIQVGDDPIWRQVGAALRNESRKAKEALSSYPYANVLVPLPAPAGLWQARVTRDEFNDVVRPYIAATITTLQRCVAEAGVQVEELAGISLVGGSTRSPIVEEMVQEAFPTVAMSRRGDPKATVAAGATLAERPTPSSPGLWRSKVTQEASPGTARQRIRLAPPPISEPPDAPLPISHPPGPSERPLGRPLDPQPSHPAAGPPSSSTGPISSPLVGPGAPASDDFGPVPVGPTPSRRPDVDPAVEPPGPPSPPPRNPPQPGTVALPTGGLLRQPPPPGRPSGKKRAVIVSMVVVVAVIAGLIAATRNGDDAETAGNSQATSQETSESSPAQPESTPDSAVTNSEQPATSAAVTDFGGAEVSIRGIESDDPSVGAINAVLQAFGESRGINVTFESDLDLYNSFDTQIQEGNLPDIGIFQEPRQLIDLARSGSIKPLAGNVTASIAANWAPDYADTATVDGVQYGVPVKTALKSLVWYQPGRFEQAGYEVPKTFDEFTALIDQMAIDGGPKALCVGIEDGDATGWVFTDWTEEMVLRQSGGDVYDQWVTHEIPFNDPRIVEAMETVLDLWADENVFAGGGNIADRSWADNAQPLIDGDCFMHRQLSFFSFVFPGGTAFADGSADAVDAFYLPAIHDDTPVLTQSYYAAPFNEEPATMAVLEYMATAEYAQMRQAEQARLASGTFSAFLSAAIGQDPSAYGPLERGFLEILNTSQLARWDASDLMPPEIGTIAFRSLGTSAVRGEITAQEAADQIEAAWSGE